VSDGDDVEAAANGDVDRWPTPVVAVHAASRPRMFVLDTGAPEAVPDPMMPFAGVRVRVGVSRGDGVRETEGTGEFELRMEPGLGVESGER
jgi:hypothetical protein